MDNAEKLSTSGTQEEGKKHNTICVGQDYAQTNANNVNKTRAFLQTNGSKDKPNIGFCWNHSEHRYPNMELRT